MTGTTDGTSPTDTTPAHKPAGDTTPTETQPKPNLSTERPQGATSDPVKPTETQPAPNISTEYQPEGGARRPAAGLDR